MNAKHFLNAQDLAEIETAVKDLEKRTRAEVVCAVATESGCYDRAEAMWGLFGSLFALLAANWIAYEHAAHTTWDEPALGFGWQCLALVCGFALGEILASYLHPIRKLFVMRHTMRHEVERAAQIVFSQRKIAATSGHTGMLIYVSLFERRAVVLADQAVFAATGGQPFLDRIRDLAIAELRAGRRAETFIKAIQAAATELEKKLPPSAEPANQLPDKVLMIHPRP